MLTELDRLRAFAPTRPSQEQIVYYIPFDQLTNSQSFETRLLSSANTPGNHIAIVAPSGEGKSSLLAYAFGEPLSPDLSENIIPVRIPIGSEKDVVTSDLYGFYRYLLRAISKRIEELGVSSQAEDEVRKIIKQTSGARKQKTTSIQAGTPKVAPNVQFSREVQTTTEQISGLTVDDARRGWDRLLDVFKSHNKDLLVYFEDTDAWIASSTGNRLDTAKAFFSGPLKDLFRNTTSSTVVAVHSSYLTEDFYKDEMRQLFNQTVHLPRLENPEQAFSLMLTKRIEVCPEINTLDDVLEPAVVIVLGDYYRSGKSLRDIFIAVNTALGEAVDRKADRITAEIMQLAISELTP